MLVPTWLHLGTQNPPKSVQKSIPRGIKKMIDFWIDFLAILAPFWEPSWSHVGHLFRAKTPPRRPKTPPGRPHDVPRRLQDTPRRPKTPQDSPKTPPRRPKPPPDDDFGTILGRVWKTFGRVLEGFFERFCRQICLLFWRIFGLPRFFACGLSCNARPPCSRSAGSMTGPTR